MKNEGLRNQAFLVGRYSVQWIVQLVFRIGMYDPIEDFKLMMQSFS